MSFLEQSSLLRRRKYFPLHLGANCSGYREQLPLFKGHQHPADNLPRIRKKERKPTKYALGHVPGVRNWGETSIPELTPKKDVLFLIKLECKSKKSRNTLSNRQIWPWSTEWCRAKANRVLPREHTGHSKHPLPTTQEKTLHTDITRWSYRNQIDYILCNQRWRSSIQSAKTRPGADCGSDHELLIAKFRLKLKKVGKTTRPFKLWLKSNPLWLSSGSDK